MATETTRSLDEFADEIVSLDRQIGVAASSGKSQTDPEWSTCDARLTRIGEALYEDGGEARMVAALQLAQAQGMRGRYVERHWTGIGSWMG